MRNPFRYFNSSPEVIRLAVMLYIRYPLSLRQVEDLLFERGIDICHEMVRLWWNRFGPMFAAEIRKRRIHHRSYSNYDRAPTQIARFPAPQGPETIPVPAQNGLRPNHRYGVDNRRTRPCKPVQENTVQTRKTDAVMVLTP